MADDAILSDLAALIERRTGLTFEDTRRRFLRVRALEVATAAGIPTLQNLARQLASSESDTPGLWQRLTDRIVTDETSWFRYPDQFDTLRDFVLPAIASNKSFSGEREIRILSAGCSKGHEPYSIAILLDQLGEEAIDGCRCSITAVDICEDGLAIARRGVYSEPDMRGFPERMRREYFTPDDSTGGWKLRSGIRQGVMFHRHNLLEPLFFPEFDIIFCRNVTIYFRRETTMSVIGHLVRALRPGGHLFVGHAETYYGFMDELKQVQMAKTFVYRRAHHGESRTNVERRDFR